MRKMICSLALAIAVFAVAAGTAAAHTGSISWLCSNATFQFVNFAAGSNTVRLYYSIDGGAEVATNRTFSGATSTQVLAVPVPNDGLTHDIDLKATWGNQSGTVNDTTTADGHSGSFSAEYEAVVCPGNGPPGPTGPSGPTGPTGQSGQNGQTPTFSVEPATTCPNGGFNIFVTYTGGETSSTTLIATVCHGASGQGGAAGPAGKDGVPGVNGTNGRDGLNGANGTSGRNGLGADLCWNLKDRQTRVPKGRALVVNPNTGEIICVRKALARKLVAPRTTVIIKRVVPKPNATKPRTAPFTP